jgi:hypothetical protein
MPDLPRILARPDLPTVNLPRTNADAYGAQAFGALQKAAGQWEVALREKQAPVDAALQSSNYDVAMEDLKNEIQADPDPTNWRTNFLAREQEKRAEISGGLTDPRIKRALDLHANRALSRNIIELSDKARVASKAKMLTDIDIVGDTLAAQAANTPDENIQRQARNTFNALITSAEQPVKIGDKTVPGLDPKSAEQLRQNFEKKYITNVAQGEIHRDPSKFLRDLNGSTKYDTLDKMALTRTANAAISTAMTIQGKEQKQKEEAADREIQDLFDIRATPDIIQKRLVEMSAAGVMDRTQRNFWDTKLIRGEKGDDGPQVANTEKLVADFLAIPPTGARIRDFRAQTNHMRNTGAIGDKGSSKMNAMLIQAEKQLRAEGRAEESAARARAGGSGKEKDISTAEGLRAIASNFSVGSPTQPILPGHKEDVATFARRILDGTRKADTVKELVTNREKKNKEAQQLQQARDAAAKADPKIAAIIETVKALEKAGKK